jgi:hypothetical protein
MLKPRRMMGVPVQQGRKQMSAQITAGNSISESQRQRLIRIGGGAAIGMLLVALIVAHALIPVPSVPTTGIMQMSAEQRSPGVDAALLESALDLGPLVSSICTIQLSGIPACYALHAEGIWIRLARQDDGTWLTVGLVIPRAEAT